MDGIKETLIFTGIHPLRSRDCLTQLQDLFRGLITGEVITSIVWIPATLDGGERLESRSRLNRGGDFSSSGTSAEKER
jgi:hypothetical protein